MTDGKPFQGKPPDVDRDQDRALLLQAQIEELRAAYGELESSRDRYADLYEGAPVGYFTLDEDGRVLDANLTGAGLLGVARDQLISQPLSRFVAGDDRDAFDLHCKTVCETGVLQDIELGIVRADGTPLYVQLESILAAGNRYPGAQSPAGGRTCRTTMRDVTRQRQARQTLLQLAAIVESSEDAVTSGTLDGTILSWNRGAERLYGYSAAEIRGRPASLLLPPGAADELPALLARIKQGERVEHYETVRMKKDGTRIDVSLTLSPLKDVSGAIIGASAVARDITELKAARQALEDAHDDAQRLVNECRLALNQRNRDLLATSRAERRQRQFAEALVQATLALNTNLDQNAVLDCILEQIQRVIPCDAAAVMLIDNGSVVVARHRGFDVSSEGLPPPAPRIPLETVPYLQTMAAQAEPSAIPGDEVRQVAQHIPALQRARSGAGAPMQGREGTIGFLNVFSLKPDAFARESIDLLYAFAGHAVVAIVNAELYTSSVEARRIAETLYSASLALTRTLDLDTVLETLLDHLGSLVPYDSACVMLLHDETHLAVRAASGCRLRGDSRDAAAETIDVRSSPLLTDLIATGQAVLIEDTAECPVWGQPPGSEPARSWLGIPLVAEDEVIGICSLDKFETGFYSPEQKQLATVLVGQAAVAVQNARLFSQVSEARRRLQSLSQRLVEVQEAERRYIARELHDEAGQSLTSLAVGLQLLEREAGRPEAVAAGLKELGRTVTAVSEDLHRLAMALRPASLDHLGLVVALRQYVQGVGQRHGLEVQYEAIGFQRRLPVDLETALFRIVQEGLTNVIRHARATRVDVVLEQLGDKLVVIVEDDGVGFDVEAGPPGDHLGLVGIRERVEMLGGRLRLESTGIGGTTLSVEVPYATAVAHRR